MQPTGFCSISPLTKHLSPIHSNERPGVCIVWVFVACYVYSLFSLQKGLDFLHSLYMCVLNLLCPPCFCATQLVSEDVLAHHTYLKRYLVCPLISRSLSIAFITARICAYDCCLRALLLPLRIRLSTQSISPFPVSASISSIRCFSYQLKCFSETSSNFMKICTSPRNSH